MNRRDFLKAGLAGGGVAGVTAIAVSRLLGDSADSDEDPVRTRTRTPAVTPAPPATGTPTDAPTPTDDPPETEQPTETATRTPTPEPVNRADEFDTVVHADLAGADPSGEDPINPVLEEHAGDDTLLAFPGGDYRIEPIMLEGYDRLGVVAAHDERPTFLLSGGSPTMNGPHVNFDAVSDFLLESVDFAFRQPRSGGQVRVIGDGDVTVRDVSVLGDDADHLSLFRVEIRRDDGVGLVENLHSENMERNDRLTGIYVGERHAGEVTFRNCDVRNYPDNGLYGSAPGQSEGAGGTVHVEGGTFANNNVSNVRLGTSGSTARDVSVIVDDVPETEAVNLRGIRLRRQDEQLVENCDITYGEDAGESFGAIVFHSDNGGATIRDTTITVDKDRLPGIFSFYNGSEYDSTPVVENVTIDGTASGGYAANFVGRKDVTFRNCEITQTGENRDGIRIANRDGALIEDCHIEVDRLPINIDDGTAEIRNTTIVNSDGERTIDEMTVDDDHIWPN